MVALKSILGKLFANDKEVVTLEDGGDFVGDVRFKTPVTGGEYYLPATQQPYPNGGIDQVYQHLGSVSLYSPYSKGTIVGIYSGGVGTFRYMIEVGSGNPVGTGHTWKVTIEPIGSSTIGAGSFKTNAYAVGGIVVAVQLYTLKVAYAYGATKTEMAWCRHTDGNLIINPTNKTDDANLNNALTVTIK